MVRFPIKVRYHTAISRVWKITRADRELVEWLESKLGDSEYPNFELPLRGPGWKVARGHRDDDDLEDVDNMYWDPNLYMNGYKPKGPLGEYLQIDDDQIAVELVLSGLLER